MISDKFVVIQYNAPDEKTDSGFEIKCDLPNGEILKHVWKKNGDVLKVPTRIDYNDQLVGKVKTFHLNWAQHVLDSYKFLSVVSEGSEPAVTQSKKEKK